MERESDSGRQNQWGNLPPDLILSIVGLLAFPDFFRLRGICRHWAQVLNKPSNINLQSHKFPLLILSSELDEQSESCTLLSLPERRLYHLSPLPQIRSRRFIGSNGNWLVTIDLALDPRLLNPFTREEAPLPSLIAIPDPNYKWMSVPPESMPRNPSIPCPINNLFRDLCIQKIVPSSHKNNGPPAVVVVAYGHKCDVRLALARPGDCDWTLVPLPLWVKLDGVSDVVHNTEDGRFYAVAKSGAVLAFHPDNPEHVTLIFKGQGHYGCLFCPKKYLVFSSGDLLVVERHRKCQDYIKCIATSSSHPINSSTMQKMCTHAFRVRKIVLHKEEFSWRRLKHLSGRCLMFGNNHSISLSPKEMPELKENCIYFTDDYPDNLYRDNKDYPHDVGIFDMKLGTIDRSLTTNYSSYFWLPPIWIFPSLPM